MKEQLRAAWKKADFSVYQLLLWGFAAAFSLISAFWALFLGETDDFLLGLGSILLVSLPPVGSLLLGFRLSALMSTVFTLYALGPIIGAFYRMYYLVSWWDDLLHFTGGVVFAMVGWFVFELMGGTGQRILAGIFALCFSVTLSVLWEFNEYAMDSFFGTDMQMDTVITRITSHDLSPEPGGIVTIDNIDSVSVNGQKLGFAGYLDIGLHDTMHDMLLETLGALLYALAAASGRGKVFQKT